jgi:hypothetical protein
MVSACATVAIKTAAAANIKDFTLLCSVEIDRQAGKSERRGSPLLCRFRPHPRLDNSGQTFVRSGQVSPFPGIAGRKNPS